MRKPFAALLLSIPSFQAVAQSWQWIAPMNQARAESEAAMMHNGKILVAGGYDQNSVLSSCEIYDPLTNSWQRTGNMITKSR
ncbi:MAG: kelch repeat-containing protein [Bacteroidota bacterium]|nr:kelch repeat-containing protein [Bacteroidota bacterium]MDP4234346.1 kelch repeat-containing protein [Bacteroidota bacterium]MDP4243280.1 kelch repeat-containing protein [Bacteroidota bacterium]MDP4289105.1 kelch repeat-containing protein [Bacteroidota bacterium]